MTDKPTCTACGNQFDPDKRHAVYRERRDGSVKATCRSCMKKANKTADAYADPQT